MDDELRSLPVEVRIIVDTEENNEDLESITVYKKDYKIYPNGTISLRQNFINKGKFVGYVTVKEEDNGKIDQDLEPEVSEKLVIGPLEGLRPSDDQSMTYRYPSLPFPNDEIYNCFLSATS